jgi:prepilin signal peptidase PulO-like enzyme (type II secretory pathway)
MSAYLIGLLVGIGAGLLILAVTKFRTRNRSMSIAEQAEFLSNRRARMLPALAVIFLAQQASYFSIPAAAPPRPVDTVKISAWLVLSIVLLAALATKGFWAHSREVRNLIDDENTRANRHHAMQSGFLFAMGAGVCAYVMTLFTPITAREAIHIMMSAGIATALIQWGFLERRAHRDA